jgi:signal transduction histidine kinase
VTPAGRTHLADAPTSAVLWATALAGCAAAMCSFVLALTSDAVSGELGEPLMVAILLNSITLGYVLCGVLAWWRRPGSRFGLLMVAVGFANFVSTLSWTSIDLAFTVGQALDLLPPVLFLHAFLAFPSGRLHGRFARILVATGYATAIGLEVVRMLFGGFGPHNLLELAPNAGAAEAVARLQFLVVGIVCLSGVGVLAARRWRAGRPLRRWIALLIDSFALGLVMIAILFLSQAFGGPAVREIRWVALATLVLAPIAFLIGLLHQRLAGSAVGELVVELRADPAPVDLRDALARALRDPSLTLAYWLPEFESYADLDGRPVELPDKPGARATTLIDDRTGARVAALIHDPTLADEPELLSGVAAAAGIALENARLHADLRARLEELRGSRARVFEAGRKERQRLERDLHDGAQQRLIALSLELGMLEAQLDDPGASRGLSQARAEIATSLGELREIARGIHPAVVSGHGLEVALEQLAARAPVPVGLTVEVDGRLPEPLEVAAYYLVSESLANLGKHALASSASIVVRQHNGQVLVEVVDDGVGGADTERGTGLRGLADRVEALDGRLRIWSPSGGGTRVRAEFPCAQ